jgi:hypothetical protein
MSQYGGSKGNKKKADAMNGKSLSTITRIIYFEILLVSTKILVKGEESLD